MLIPISYLIYLYVFNRFAMSILTQNIVQLCYMSADYSVFGVLVRFKIGPNYILHLGMPVLWHFNKRSFMGFLKIILCFSA